MKELSIEEKARRYDEAFKRAESVYNETAIPSATTKGTCTYIFPELAESEDEKIRKDLIRLVEESTALRDYYDLRKMTSWLERQDKCKIDYPLNHQDSNCPNGSIVLEDFNGGEGFYKIHLDCLNKKQVEEIEEMIRVWNKDLKTSNENIKDCIGMCLTDVNEQRFKDYGTNLRDCLAWLEKQGEQPKKHDVCNNCDQQGSCVSPCPMKLVEKQGEQKPADKVEPKFEIEEGEWYICIRDLLDNYANRAFCKGYIYLSTQNGSLIPSNSNVPFKIVCPDTYFRHWTIQDAKDGDVLAAHECLVLFKEIDGLNIRCYCTYHYLNHQAFYVDTLQNKTSFHPATKEQRDQLEKAITESGYKWDAEKKELKKIEKKPTDSKIIDLDELVIELEETIGTSPHSRETIKYFFQKAVQKYMKCLQIANGEIGRLMDENYHLKEQKPAWSEEDEKHYRSLLCLFECVSPKEEDTCWFKTIKNRVQLQQEWSEEDERMRSVIWNSLDMECLTAHGVTIEKVLDWFDSLKDRVQQKSVEWCDQDERVLRTL